MNLGPKRHGSESVCGFPLVGCLVAAEQELGPDRQWNFAEGPQADFDRTFFSHGRTKLELVPEMKYKASRDCQVINGFLRGEGFDIQLDPYQPPDFGVAAVLKVLVEWLQEGEVTKVVNGMYDAVKIDHHNVNFFQSPAHEHPIAWLTSKDSETSVLMTRIHPEKKPDLFEYVDFINGLNEGIQRCHNYGGVIFPMVDYDEEVDISWMVGLQTQGDDGLPGIIAQAKQQTKFQMNEVGAKVESAAAMMVTRGGGPPPPYVIDQPFLCWVQRKGLDEPLFIGWFEEDCWKNPGTLD